MACPECGTQRVKVTEPGVISNELVCENGHYYRKLNSGLMGLFSLGLAIVTGGLFVDGMDGTFGDDFGGGGNT